MKPYPHRDRIAVSPYETDLPDSRYGWDKEKYKNNHHGHYYAKMFGKAAVFQCLRDLDRMQWEMPIDVHNWWHDIYGPAGLPTEERAAREVIDAYEHGEQFKRYDRHLGAYRYDDIPPELVDTFVAKYGLERVIFDMAAD